MRDASMIYVSDMLGIALSKVEALAIHRGMPHDRGADGAMLFDLGEVDEWVGALDVDELRVVFTR